MPTDDKPFIDSSKEVDNTFDVCARPNCGYVFLDASSKDFFDDILKHYRSAHPEIQVFS